jgi:hypothetical protein
MPVVRRLTTYPVKSLDGHDRTAARLLPAGGLETDREFALVDADGNYVNGKRERAVHDIHSSFDPETLTLTLATSERPERRFALDDETDRAVLTDWLSDYFGYEVSLRRDETGGFPDDTDLAGPTVVAAATLREVGSWYGIDADEMGRRLRPNVVVDADREAGEDPLPAFWEDRLYAGEREAVPFRLGDVELHGRNPCQRCVVPSRDPDTGAETPRFRERFVERREATLPAWAPRERFDHFFRLMVNTTVPGDSVGETLRVGDPVTVGEPRPV